MLFVAPHSAMSAGGTQVFTVKGVPFGDVLNIRNQPKASAAVVGKLKNGDQGFVSVLDCWNSKTRKKIPPSQLSRSKPNQWCSVQAGDEGDINGFARFKYIELQ